MILISFVIAKVSPRGNEKQKVGILKKQMSRKEEQGETGTLGLEDSYEDSMLQPVMLHNGRTLCAPPARHTVIRLTQEYRQIHERPLTNITLQPDESNICIWYFLINGPLQTPYEEGLYLGVMMFPPNYPYGAPEIQMISPSGRFRPRHSICLSMSSFHQEDWRACFTVEHIMMALVSLMCSEEVTTGSYNAIAVSNKERRKIASESKKWLFDKCKIFPVVFPHEYLIIRTIVLLDFVAANFQNLILECVLNEPLQNLNSIYTLKLRVSSFVFNIVPNQLVLFEYSAQVQKSCLCKFFRISTTARDIYNLGLYCSIGDLTETSSPVDEDIDSGSNKDQEYEEYEEEEDKENDVSSM